MSLATLSCTLSLQDHLCAELASHKSIAFRLGFTARSARRCSLDSLYTTAHGLGLCQSQCTHSRHDYVLTELCRVIRPDASVIGPSLEFLLPTHRTFGLFSSSVGGDGFSPVISFFSSLSPRGHDAPWQRLVAEGSCCAVGLSKSLDRCFSFSGRSNDNGRLFSSLLSRAARAFFLSLQWFGTSQGDGSGSRRLPRCIIAAVVAVVVDQAN